MSGSEKDINENNDTFIYDSQLKEKRGSMYLKD
jgi:hypothetical protein